MATAGGNSILATWSTPNSLIQPALGRPLSAGATTKSINLVEAGTLYGNNNLQQLDLRASKRFTMNRYHVRFDFDLYNIFNSNWPFTVSSAFSTSASAAGGWLRPTNVLPARFFKLGMQFDF
jgi:hypothetical protein